MAMRSKVGIIKTGYVSGPPKKTRQGNGNGTNTLRLPAIMQRKNIADKENEESALYL